MAKEEDVVCTPAQLRALKDEAKTQAVRELLAPVKSKQQTGYYSQIAFDAAVTGAGPFTYTIAAGPRVAFGYKQGDLLGATQGFVTGVNATLQHTNLSDPGKTRDGE